MIFKYSVVFCNTYNWDIFWDIFHPCNTLWASLQAFSTPSSLMNLYPLKLRVLKETIFFFKLGNIQHCVKYSDTSINQLIFDFSYTSYPIRHIITDHNNTLENFSICCKRIPIGTHMKVQAVSRIQSSLGLESLKDLYHCETFL